MMYAQEYEEAHTQYQAKRYAEAACTAKYSLTDLNLPLLWQIRSCALVVCAETDFDEAQRYLTAAEELFRIAKSRENLLEDYAQKHLADLRIDLDNAAKDLNEQLDALNASSEGVDEVGVEGSEDEGDGDVYGDFDDDTEAQDDDVENPDAFRWELNIERIVRKTIAREDFAVKAVISPAKSASAKGEVDADSEAGLGSELQSLPFRKAKTTVLQEDTAWIKKTR